MKEDIVSYELAVKLKEMGFCGEVTGKYVDCTNDPTLFHGMLYQSWNLEDDEILAPRLDQVQKWLREVKGIDIEIIAHQHLDGESIKHQYNFGVLTINGETYANTWYNNYEEALSDAIDTALELLTNQP